MKVLHINASPRQEKSISLEFAQRFLNLLQSKGAVTVDTLNLYSEDLPEFGENEVAAKMALFTGEATTESQRQAWDRVRSVFDRFAAADLYVINTPMWNNGVPYKLKQYIDLVTQPGWAFGYDPAKGYFGLLENRRAFVVHSAGIHYPGIAPSFGEDQVQPYLRSWLGLLGLLGLQPSELVCLTSNTEGDQNTKLQDASWRKAVQFAASLGS